MNRSAAEAAGLEDRAVSATQWRIASTLLQGVLHLATGIVLARLLLPAQFGVAALALVVIGLATMIADAGVGSAVVQQRLLTDRHLHVAFTLALISGAVIAAALLIAAPWLGAFARNRDVIPVLRVESLLFVAAGAGMVGRAVLQRALDFRLLFRIDLASYILGYAVVAIGGALAGWGVWALVAGALVQSVLASVLAVLTAKAPVGLSLAAAERRELLGFGSGVTLNGVVNYVARNGDNFLVGRLLGAAALGFYARAFNFMMLPLNYVCSALPNILIPALSAVQTDRERVGRGYLIGVQTAVLITAPVMAVIMVVAPSLIRGLYGLRWDAAVLPLQILAAAGVARAVIPLAGAVTRATNSVGRETRLQVVFAILVVVGAVAGARAGLPGVAACVSIAIVVMYAATARLALQLTGATWRRFAMAHVAGLLLGCAALVTALGMRAVLRHVDLPDLAQVVLVSTGAMGMTLLALHYLPVAARPALVLQHLDRPLARLPRFANRPLRRLLGVTG